MARTALVTGANRGIGLAVCRQLARYGLDVVLTARDPRSGRAAVARLKDDGLEIAFEELDVSDEASVEACAGRLASAGAAIDVLVNNAGVAPEGRLAEMPTASMREALDVNLLGAFWTSRAFLPGMVGRGYGRIVNVSSGWGSFGEGLEGPPAYSISKAALNALTRKLAEEVPPTVKVNSLCPGWVRTRMGGAEAPTPVEEGADTVVWLATLRDDGPSGGFFRSREPIPW